MDDAIEVTLRGYDSASGYSVDWEAREDRFCGSEHESHSKYYSNVAWLDTFRLLPGDFLLADWYESDWDHRTVLIQVPPDGPRLDEFKRAAATAAAVPDCHDDSWILGFGVMTWNVNDESFIDSPITLDEAVKMYDAHRIAAE